MNNMINDNRLIFNLDLDLLRTFVAVADLNTFGAAAIAISRTQSAVSQQMQRLELLVGKELFIRHGRNKLLTEQGVQLLGYARTILQCNDQACLALRANHLEGGLTLWAADETTDSVLPAQLNYIRSIYPKLILDVAIKTHPFEDLESVKQSVDLIIATAHPPCVEATILRQLPTFWYCAADYRLCEGKAIPLIVTREPDTHRQMMLATLSEAGIAWRIAYEAPTLTATYSALKAGLGITARPADMKHNEALRMLGGAEGLPPLAQTTYFLCKHRQSQNEIASIIFTTLSSELQPTYYCERPEKSEMSQPADES